jgi:outer membrane protein TolC
MLAGAVIAWLATGPADAAAQAPPAAHEPSAPVTLAAALESAWQRAVARREVEGQQRKAQAGRHTAASQWAAPPALELSHRDDRLQSNAGRRETEVALAWPLWLPGQQAAQAAAADASLAEAGHALAAARLRVAGEVREQAWALVALQAEGTQADALLQSLAGLVDDVERRVRAGDLARADALAARAEHAGARARQAEARQRLLEAHRRWTALTGLQALPAMPTVSGSEAQVMAAADPASHPEQLLASATTEHARKRLDLLRTARRDAPELTVGLRQDVSGRAEPTQHSLALSLRLPFGTDARNQPLQAVALAELDVAQASEQRVHDRLAAELTAARAALDAAREQWAAEREQAVLLRERAQLIERSFRAGESPLPDLLRALGAAAQADAGVARRQAALGQAHARLQQALGLLP